MKLDGSTIPKLEEFTEQHYTTMEWRKIDWKMVEKKTYVLQRKIAEAGLEGDMVKVKTYQRILTSSINARLLAIRLETMKVVYHKVRRLKLFNRIKNT